VRFLSWYDKTVAAVKAVTTWVEGKEKSDGQNGERGRGRVLMKRYFNTRSDKIQLQNVIIASLRSMILCFLYSNKTRRIPTHPNKRRFSYVRKKNEKNHRKRHCVEKCS
jgi:hypothetical protein